MMNGTKDTTIPLIEYSQWSEKALDYFISLMKSVRKDLKSYNTKYDLFKAISDRMTRRGYSFQIEHYQKEWQNLQNLSETCRGSMEPELIELFEEIAELADDDPEPPAKKIILAEGTSTQAEKQRTKDGDKNKYNELEMEVLDSPSLADERTITDESDICKMSPYEKAKLKILRRKNELKEEQLELYKERTQIIAEMRNSMKDLLMHIGQKVK